METAQQSQCPMHALEDEYNPLVDPQLSDPYPVWARARHECPVFFSKTLGAYVVTTYEDIITVLRDHGVFGPGVERKMFAEACPEADLLLEQLPPLEAMKAHSSEPPLHTKLRRYLQPAFFPHKAAEKEPKFRQIANDLIDEFIDRGHGDFYQDYAYLFPLRVIGSYIGLPEADFPQITTWADQQQQLRYAHMSPEDQMVAAQGQLDSFQYTLDLVAKRRAEPSDDLMSGIIADSDASDDPLTDEQLASQATTMLTAGHETSSHFLTMLVGLVLKHREHWDVLVADPTASAEIVEESLRISGPVQSIWRRAKADAEVGGVTIPSGSRVAVVLGSGNHDELVFEEPELFEVDRANVAQHIAFGRGIHTCVGAGVARMESVITLELLATRMPKLRLATEDGDLMFKPSATQRMARRLLVEWT